jgi:flagellar P-ring protein precursor FlgI
MWRQLLSRLFAGRGTRRTDASSLTLAERIAQGNALAEADARALAARRAADAIARAAALAATDAVAERRADAPRTVRAADASAGAGAVESAVTDMLRVPGVADQSRLTPPIGAEIIRRRNGRPLLIALAACLGGALDAGVAQAQDASIRELTIAEGAAPIRLTGYGIVVGLDGTGDRTTGGAQGGMTVQSVVNLLRNFSVEVPSTLVRTRNAAVVLVTTEISPYLRAGGRFDVHVSSLGDARSLRGGVLYMAPLVAEAGGRPVAVAQGTLLLSEAADARTRWGAPPIPETTARIPAGGQLEADLPRPTFAGATRLLLKEPDVTTASRIAAAVNAALGPNTARVEDPGAVALALPDTGDRAATLGRIVALGVRPERTARIVIDARDGTVVAGGELAIGAAVVSHAGVTLSIGGEGAAPAAGASAGAAPRADVGIPGDVRVAPGTSVQRVAAALHAVQTPASDIAAIFAALREVGALSAEVVVR